jgi:hypothetical protein
MGSRLLDLGGLSLALLLLGSCAELGDREPDVCGNGITESESLEYCDGQEGCIAPDAAAGACFWSCADDECPDGLVCGMDEVCRLPGFDFEQRDPIGTERVVWVAARDMDADGRDDLVIVEAEDGAEVGNLVVTFSDANGPGAQRWEWPSVTATPDLEDMDGDGLVDLVLLVRGRRNEDNDTGALILQNDGSRGFTAVPAVTALASRPDPFDFQVRPRSDGRTDVAIAGYEGRYAEVETGQPFLSPAIPGKTTLGFNREPLPGNADDCSHPRVVFGQVEDDEATPDEDEGLKLDVYALCPNEDLPDEPGLTHLSVVRVPDPGGFTLRTSWADFEDVNLDGHVDLMTGVRAQIDTCERCIAVAYGVGDGTFHSDRDEIPDSDGDGLFDLAGPHPYAGETIDAEVLARGDVNGDLLEDYLFEDQLALSKLGACQQPGAGECVCGPDRICPGGVQSLRGAFVDLGGQPGLEVVSLSPTGYVGGETVLDVYAVEGSELHPWEIIALPGNPRELAVADYDSDGNDDVAIAFQSTNGPDQLGVLWGGQLPAEITPVSTGLNVPDLFGVANEGVVDTVQWAERLVVLAGLPTEGDPDRTGLLRFLGDADRRIVAPIQTEDRGSAAVRVGQFGTENPELVISNDAYDLERVGIQIDGGRVVTESWGEGPAYGNETYFPDMDMEVLTGDLDGDGIDEVVRLGDVRSEGAYLGFTVSAAAKWVDGEWATSGSRDVEYATAGSAWPDPDPTMVELRDVDGDGSLDIYMVTRLRLPTPEGGGTLDARAPVVLFNDGGGVFGRAQFASDGADPVSGLRTWSFFSDPVDARFNVFMISGDEVQTGVFDGETGEIAFVETFAAPTVALWSASGDFDGDGLADVAVATDAGVVPYFGASAFGEQEELEFVGGYFDPTPEADEVEPPENPAAVIYLNFDGGLFKQGPTNSANNTYFLDDFQGGRQIPSFGIGPRRAEILAKVREHFAPFNVWVTDVRPDVGRYVMAVINPGFPELMGQAATWSVDGCTAKAQDTSQAIVFSHGAAWGEVQGPTQIAVHTSGPVAFSQGLACSEDSRDLSFCGGTAPEATFQDRCITLQQPGACHWHECSQNTQNPFQELLELWGPAE